MFRATVTSGTRWTLNAAAIRAQMGELRTVARSKVAIVTTVHITARTSARKAA